MKQFGKKALRITGMVVLGLLLILAGYFYWTWPVYPAEEKELDSIAELREMLRDCDQTEGLVMVDLTEFGADSQRVYVYVDGSTRTANPYCGYVRGADDGVEGRYTLWMEGKLAESSSQPGDESYRDLPARQELSDIEMPDGTTVHRGMYLELRCGEYAYTVGASFDKTGLSQQEISDGEAKLEQLVHAVADKIIDGTAKG